MQDDPGDESSVAPAGCRQLRSGCDAVPHLELVVDVVFLGRPRVVVERRMPAGMVLVCEPVDDGVPWRAHRW